ncbi:MAG TPA: glycoside hydrolase family 127 protein [Longimicrobiales bacterium]
MERREFLKTGVVAGVAVLGGGACASASSADVAGPAPRGGRLDDPLGTEARLLAARPLPLSSVRLTGGPLKRAQDLNAAYLLALEPDRMLAFYRERAGLKRKAEPYGGWDGPGRNLTGHIAGHYLSAVSLMWAATGDERFKQRADYLVAELKAVQDAHGDGYLCAMEGGREAFEAVSRGEIRSAGFDLNGLWAPWYTAHKTYAGLRDAYRYTGNRTALEVLIRFAEWAERILSPLDHDQIQLMLRAEFGGMNEVLVDLYADTGDPRWLKLSYAFEDLALIEPLQRHQDPLNGKHGNTQIPKLVGSADRFAYTGRAGDLVAAAFFWDRVVQHHTFATGGHGKDEYFGPPGQLSNMIDGRTAESCNIYNMLKLTRRLFAFRPDPFYADYMERALFNHVLGSIDPEDGSTCYMVPVGRGVRREYQRMFESFTCCVGTGMENHALHGDGIYYEAGDRLWVNLYVPSIARWEAAGVELTMETDFPEGESATITLRMREPKEFTLSLRRPYWTGDGFTVQINGQAAGGQVATKARGGEPQELREPSTYVDLRRTWRDGDVVKVSLPKSLRLERLPDNPRRAAILWGPLVLAGDLGPEPAGGPGRSARFVPPVVPVLVANADQPLDRWISRKPGSPAIFRTVGAGREPTSEGRTRDVDLVPFYRLHRRIYAAYWDIFNEAEWEEQRAMYAAEEERLRKLQAATVAYVQPGEMQPERDFNFQGGPDVQVRRILDRPARAARTWFSFDVPVESGRPMALLVTYYSDDRRSSPATFEILVDGQRVATQTIQRTEPPRFFDVEYPLPEHLVRGKQKVTVRFQAVEGSQIAAVFGLRMVRADMPR